MLKIVKMGLRQRAIRSAKQASAGGEAQPSDENVCNREKHLLHYAENL